MTLVCFKPLWLLSGVRDDCFGGNTPTANRESVLHDSSLKAGEEGYPMTGVRFKPIWLLSGGRDDCFGGNMHAVVNDDLDNKPFVVPLTVSF